MDKPALTQASGTGSTRREFFGHACRVATIAAAGSAMASLLQSCGGGGPTSGSYQPLPTVSGNEAGGAITLAVGATSPLASVGSVALLQSSAGSLVLVAHTATDAFSALSAACTHLACTVSGYSGQTFVCPCHGSQFSANGQVITGPAAVALRQHHTQFANGVLTITA